jgi:hypothetical protein
MSDGSTHRVWRVDPPDPINIRVWRVDPPYPVNKWVWRVNPSDLVFFFFFFFSSCTAARSTPSYLNICSRQARLRPTHYSTPGYLNICTQHISFLFFFFLLHTHHFSLFSQFFYSFFFPLLFHSTPRLPPSFFFLFLFPFFTIFSTQHHSLEFELHTRHFHDTQLLHCYSPLKRRLTLVTPCP